jgi:hypothetical protein
MAGTTNSSGLNNLLTSTNQVETTLPSWMNAAQQSVVNQANTAVGQAPQFGQTSAQNAVNTLQSPDNPFTFAQNNLQQISSGAANPWNTDPTTGALTPNTSTAMGGLFQAQRDQLNQTLPTLTAGTEAGAIGSGNFGSLRGQTAVNNARGNAVTALTAQQMQAALQNQQYGTQAAKSLSDVGTAGINANLGVGSAEMNAPFQGATNYSNLINSVNAPTTVSQQNQQSPLQMMSTLAGAPSTTGNLLSSLFGSSAQSGTLSNALKNIPGLSSLFNSSSNTKINDTTGMNLSQNQDPSGSQQAGLLQGSDNKWYVDPSYGTGLTSGGGSLVDTNPDSQGV